MYFPTDLTTSQILLVDSRFGRHKPRLRKYSLEKNSQCYGLCDENRVSMEYDPPRVSDSGKPYTIISDHGARGDGSLRYWRCWQKGKRAANGRNPKPSVGVVDSQSVRSALPHSQKGIDGHKRIKGIKRHMLTDSQGYPLSIYVTTANVHDSKAPYPLIANGLTRYPKIGLIKADKGYCGTLEKLLPQTCGVVLECVKSNFGTPDFIPIKGGWVAERTFSWLENSRRLTRNYEKLLKVARGIVKRPVCSSCSDISDQH